MLTEEHRSSRRRQPEKGLPLRVLLSSAAAWIAIFAAGCGTEYRASLPASDSLGTVGAFRIARVITHFHTPYSFDACDKEGLAEDVPNASCLLHLRQALCTNRVDALFLTDHPDNMARFGFRELLLTAEGDEPALDGNGSPYANHTAACANGHRSWIWAGFEGRIMPMGMTGHLEGTAASRLVDYGLETPDLVERLRQETGAVIAIPHPESRSVETIRGLQPDLIEIYNIHANLDPKIRKRDLGEPPFENLASLMAYIVDPYDGMLPDFAFMSFFKLFQVHFDRWNALLADGSRIGGIAGSDSHENVFSQEAADGERLDGHRRMMRFVSNHVLAPSLDPLEIKEALRRGRSWMVVEGLGTPRDFAFRGTQGATLATPGDALRLSSGALTLSASLSGLHPESPGELDETPEIRLELRRVASDASESMVASGGNRLDLTVTLPGAYRVHAWIRPRHLRDFLGPFEGAADREFAWIVSNPIRVEP